MQENATSTLHHGEVEVKLPLSDEGLVVAVPIPFILHVRKIILPIQTRSNQNPWITNSSCNTPRIDITIIWFNTAPVPTGPFPLPVVACRQQASQVKSSHFGPVHADLSQPEPANGVVQRKYGARCEGSGVDVDLFLERVPDG